MFAFNQGEVCTCPSRALIQESIYDRFIERAIGLAVIRCFRRFRKYSVVVAAPLAGEGRRDIKVMKEFGNLPQIECYAGLLNQAFLNIINHAIDALEESAQ